MNKITTVIAVAAFIMGGIVGMHFSSETPSEMKSDGSYSHSISENHPARRDDFQQPSGYSLHPEIVDFGRLREGQAKDFRVALKHPGKEDVRISRITSTCPCVSASGEKMIIPASEEGTIKVNYHALPANGKKLDYYYIELLEPEKVTLRGTVRGVVKRVPAQILAEPPILHFGSVAEKQTRKLKVWNLTKNTMRIKVEDAGGLSCDSAGTALTAMPGKAVEIELVADPSTLSKGSLRGKLRLSTSLDLHKEIVVPFDGTVR